MRAHAHTHSLTKTKTTHRLLSRVPDGVVQCHDFNLLRLARRLAIELVAASEAGNLARGCAPAAAAGCRARTGSAVAIRAVAVVVVASCGAEGRGGEKLS